MRFFKYALAGVAAIATAGFAVFAYAQMGQGPGMNGMQGGGMGMMHHRMMQNRQATNSQTNEHGGMQGSGGMHGAGMHGMGGGMQGGGTHSGGMMGMMGGNATMDERRDLHDLFSNHDRIKRAVTNLPDGIRTVTESDDPQVAATIKKHVVEMGQRVKEGRDPGLPIETPALHAIFSHKDKIKTAYEVTEKGIIVVQTSTDADAVKALQEHAAEVTDLAQRGMIAAHEAMVKNGGGMMGRGMRAAMANPQHRH